MKLLTSIVTGAALALTPVIAEAAPHGGGGGGFHGGGGARGGGGYRGGGGVYRGGGGYRGGYRGGYYGGRGWGGWGYGFYGPAFGLALGYYANPWLWGYPYDYYGYPYYPAYSGPAYDAPVYNGQVYNGQGSTYDAPPATYSSNPQAPQACGSWQWDATAKQYHWNNSGC